MIPNMAPNDRKLSANAGYPGIPEVDGSDLLPSVLVGEFDSVVVLVEVFDSVVVLVEVFDSVGV